jgi:hypothetical protein
MIRKFLMGCLEFIKYTLAIISIVIVILVCSFFYWYFYSRDTILSGWDEFDSQAWKTRVHHDVGCRMYSDLAKNKLKIGMSYNEIIALLGPSKENFSDKVYFYGILPNKKQFKCIKYYIGNCLEGGIIAGGSYHLKVCFDRDNKLIAFYDKPKRYWRPSDKMISEIGSSIEERCKIYPSVTFLSKKTFHKRCPEIKPW